MYGCEMVWPLPIGSGWLRYASATCAAGTRRWRSTLASAARTAGDMLERPVELARDLLLDQVDDLLDPDEVVGAGGDRHVRALVVRAALRDALGAWAQAGHRDDHLHGEALPALVGLALEGHLVVHQALHARHRRLLLAEVREAHLDVAFLGPEGLDHLAQHDLAGLDG